MPRPRTIQLARILGIRVGVSTSWFFFLFVLIYWLSGSFHQILGGSSTTAYVVAVAGALSFFGSLILHELGHALVARRAGIEISGIDLWFFGGLARMSREAATPGEEFRVAVAGPLVTLALIVICALIGIVAAGARHFLDVASYQPGTSATPLLVLVGWLATINVALLLFNLVPAFPLDGGRMARAVAWWRTGDRNRATRASARVGQAFAYLLAAAGGFLLLTGDIGSGLWFAVMGLFLGQAARGAVLQSALGERLEATTVADIMDSDPVTVTPQSTVIEVHDTVLSDNRLPAVPVVDAERHPLGMVTRERVDRELAEGRPALEVGELLDREGAGWSIGQDQSLDDLMHSEGLRRMGAVAAVDADGVLRGVVGLSELRRALAPATGV